MSARQVVGAALGAVAGAIATGVVVERRVVRARRRAARDADALGSLRSSARVVTASDGLRLHAEIDEVTPYADAQHQPDGGPTVVLAHGYALNLDCWHYQRSAMRGKRRLVLYDQRSHGRSDRSSRDAANIDQLGHDLDSVLGQLVPQDKLVLVGHSMGGMSILAFAEKFPERFRRQVAGVVLIATAAGDMHPHETIASWVPDGLGEVVALRTIAALAKAPELVDSARKLGSNIGYLVIQRFAFGGEVPPAQIEFLDSMLAGTSMDVLAAFFPHFESLDKYAVLSALAHMPVTVICGDRDRMTPIAHSRRLAGALPHANLVECAGAGHMVLFEQPGKVNAAIEALVDAVGHGRPGVVGA